MGRGRVCALVAEHPDPFGLWVTMKDVLFSYASYQPAA